MFAEIRMGACFGVLGMGILGCAGVGEVRYVYQDGQAGVIGLPENTSRWPTYYRKHADELMAKHFPEGYEIVRAEEVVEGSRTLTLNGTKAAELSAKAPTEFLSLGKFGRTSSRTQSDTLKIKECRIVYKKAEPSEEPGKHGDYAEQAAWTPTTYIDPNAPARHPGGAKPEASKDACVPGPANAAGETKDAKPPERGKEGKTSEKLPSAEDPKVATPGRPMDEGAVGAGDKSLAASSPPLHGEAREGSSDPTRRTGAGSRSHRRARPARYPAPSA